MAGCLHPCARLFEQAVSVGSPHCYWALRLGPRGSQSLLHGGTGKPGGLEEPQKQWGLWIVGPSSLLHHSLVREASSPGLTLNQVHAPCE